MKMFSDRLQEYGDRPALISSNAKVYSYVALSRAADLAVSKLPEEKQLVRLAMDNSNESIIMLLGLLRARHAVVIADVSDKALCRTLDETYHPGAISDRGAPLSPGGFANTSGDIHPDLSMLLSTSGSSGNVKCVRLSFDNLESNARSIVEYLSIESDHKSMLTLPLSYCYGLSVVNSHLAAGASIITGLHSLTSKDFYSRLEESGATSFACVPYSFEFLERFGFRQMDLPRLKYITQAGGHLSKELVRTYAEWAEQCGKRFFVMYGQTEATARMAYLPPAKAKEYSHCIGAAIPGGKFRLLDDEGRIVIDADTPGELVYSGPNVMLGYATSREDLTSGRDVLELNTGDIACQNTDGIFYLVGRKSRFSKLYGKRLNLDDTEKFFAERKYHVVCVSDDKTLFVVSQGGAVDTHTLQSFCERFELAQDDVETDVVSEYPLLSSGKIDYQTIAEKCRSLSQKRLSQEMRDESRSIREIFSNGFNGVLVDGDSTFSSLGGDSLVFVQISMEIEKELGLLPDDWSELTVDELENFRGAQTAASKIESSVLLRALAITGVVANHAGLLSVRGGAATLFLLAGYSLSRFQSHRMFNGEVWKTIYSYCAKIIPAYVVLTIAYLVWKQSFEPGVLLMYSNFVGPSATTIIPVWFIQVLIQSFLIIGALLSIRPIREWGNRDPWRFAVAFLLVSALVRVVMDGLWDTNYLYRRVPHICMVLIAAGWLIASAKSPSARLIALLLHLSLVGVFYGGAADSVLVWLVCSGLILTGTPMIVMPKAAKRVIFVIGAASYYIFLLHMIFIHFARNVFELESPLIEFAAGMSGSICVFGGAEWIRVRGFHARTRAAALQEH